MPRLLLPFLVFCLLSVAHASERLAVLEIESAAVGMQERSLLTDSIRGGAVTSLQGRVKVMTRENMEVMLADMGIDADCVAEGACEVETARNLGVDYVLSGSVSQVAGVLILSLKLHETRGGELLGSKQARADDILGLIDAADGLAQGVLQPIGGRVVSTSSGVTVAPNSAADSTNVLAAPSGPIPQSFRGLESQGEVESDLLGKLVCISSGAFVMGTSPDSSDRRADEVQRRVTLTRDFCVMEHEVNQGQWEALGNKNLSEFRKKCGEACPVERVSWLEAVSFANAASERDGLVPAYTVSGSSVQWDPTATGYRLPTEAEWEAAARGREDDSWAGGASAGAVAWTAGNSGGALHPSCALGRNGYGLCDMSGNVSEWVWDLYAVDPTEPVVDPAGPTSGTARVVRGGGWHSASADDARVSFRYLADPQAMRSGLGFRLVRNAP